MKRILPLAIATCISSASLSPATVSANAANDFAFALGASMAKHDDVSHNEYANPLANISYIHRVLIDIEIPSQYKVYISDPYFKQSYPDIFKKQLDPYFEKVTTPNSFIQEVSIATGKNIVAIFQAGGVQLQEAQKLLFNYYIKNYDAIIQLNAIQYEYVTEFQEGITYNSTSYNTGTIVDNRGNMATVTTPHTEQRTVGRGDVRAAIVNFDIRMVDGNNTLICARSEARKRSKNNVQLVDVAKKITGNYANDIKKLMKATKK